GRAPTRAGRDARPGGPPASRPAAWSSRRRRPDRIGVGPQRTRTPSSLSVGRHGWTETRRPDAGEAGKGGDPGPAQARRATTPALSLPAAHRRRGGGRLRCDAAGAVRTRRVRALRPHDRSPCRAAAAAGDVRSGGSHAREPAGALSLRAALPAGGERVAVPLLSRDL